MSEPGPAGADDRRRPLFRVVRGTPDDVEVAALATVLAAVTARSAEPIGAAEAAPSRWTDRTAHLRGTLTVGPDAWRTSTWPR